MGTRSRGELNWNLEGRSHYAKHAFLTVSSHATVEECRVGGRHNLGDCEWRSREINETN